MEFLKEIYNFVNDDDFVRYFLITVILVAGITLYESVVVTLALLVVNNSNLHFWFSISLVFFGSIFSVFAVMIWKKIADIVI